MLEGLEKIKIEEVKWFSLGSASSFQSGIVSIFAKFGNSLLVI
jgi:hypothetical protein